MKKLLILLLTFSLFTACNNEKGTRKDRDTRTNSTRDKDDYRNDDDNRKTRDDDDDKRKSNDDEDKGNTREDDDNRKTSDDDRTSSSGWSSGDVNEFLSSCINSAVDAEGGMSRKQATDYCECMQVKLEKLYPNPNDVGNIDINSSSMQKMVKDCL